MKDRFRGYYPLTDDELERVWSDATIVLDTNALLGLYGRTQSTRKTFVEALDVVAERLWMPHQVGLEFHRNRANTRSKATAEHTQVAGSLSASIEKARKQAKQLTERDHQLKTEQAFDRLDRATMALKEALDRSKERLTAERREGGDPVMDVVERLYPSERIGEPFQPKELSRQRRRAAERYAAEQPPGFADLKAKTGDRVFGDYFLWEQTLQYAKDAASDVILVSDDRTKGDWIDTDGSPLPALRSEFYERTGHDVLILDSKTFLEEVSRRITNADIDEVERAAEELEEAATTSEQTWAGLGAVEWPTLGSDILAGLGPNLVAPGLLASISNQLATGIGDLFIPTQRAMAIELVAALRQSIAQGTSAQLISALGEASRQAAIAAQNAEDADSRDDAESGDDTDSGDDADSGD